MSKQERINLAERELISAWDEVEDSLSNEPQTRELIETIDQGREMMRIVHERLLDGDDKKDTPGGK